MNRNVRLAVMAFLAVLGPVTISYADTFGNGANSFSIDFVPIGNPENPADTTGSPNPAGSVPYAYRIGKYEISEQMVAKANALGMLGIMIDVRGPDKPATSVTWFEAAQFVNWLNTSTGGTPAYKFDAGGNFQLWEPSDPGYDGSNRFRNSLATYFLPSANEWYKAAYYDPAAGVYWDYSTGSDAPPTAVANGTVPGTAVYHLDESAGPADVMQAGGLSPYGTVAQGGNVAEWEETALNLINDDPLEIRGGRGAAWAALSFSLSSSIRAGALPSNAGTGGGFRVASIVPEPNAAALLLTAYLFAIVTRRRRGAFASR
jgi:formylglycine-generating enzyme